VAPCSSPLVYSNGQCVCPAGTSLSGGSCLADPSCPSGQVWNGSLCKAIACAVGFFWNGSACLQYVQACALGTYWNGLTCVTSTIECPSGSTWNGTYCAALPSCAQGTYLSGGQCVFFPQLCLPNYSWNGTGCLAVGKAASCSSQQIFNGTACLSVNCSEGRTWSSLYKQCVCNDSSFWNGLGCVGCPSGQIFSGGSCTCPPGYFLVSGLCYSLQQVYCSFVNAASWNSTHCQCVSGFTAVGVSCIC
jgi:hypothetical protein